MSVLRVPMTIAASVAMSAMVGVVAWGILKPSKAAVTGPARVATSAPVQAPQPANDSAAPDHSTPDNTLASLCTAFEKADRVSVYACLYARAGQNRTAFEADTNWDLANRRMMLAAEQAYGADAAKRLNDGYTPLEAALRPILAFRQLQGDPPIIDGDSSKIIITFPPALMNILPAGFQQDAHIWDGKAIYFQKQDGAWRLDLDRSIRDVMYIWKAGSSRRIQPDEKLMAAIFKEEADNRDAIAGEIGLGTLPRVEDAQQLLQTKNTQLFKKFQLTSLYTDIVPAEPAHP